MFKEKLVSFATKYGPFTLMFLGGIALVFYGVSRGDFLVTSLNGSIL